jgi:hypothetical protein
VDGRVNLGRLRVLLGRARAVVRLELLRERLWKTPADATISLAGMRLRITDGPNTYMQYKDEFLRRNYAFTALSAARTWGSSRCPRFATTRAPA